MNVGEDKMANNLGFQMIAFLHYFDYSIIRLFDFIILYFHINFKI